MAHTVTSEVIERARSGSLSLLQVKAITTEHDLSLTRVLDLASLEVARRYQAGALAFEHADRIMNGLWGVLFGQPPEDIEIPEITEEIYVAFDSGEYHHPDDPRDVDPEAKYTRPLVAAALLKYGNDA